MVRLLISVAATAALLPGAVIRGVVVENESGHPLARALVVAQPIPGTDEVTQSVRTDPQGAFQFPALAAGAYLVIVSRRGFAPVHYGQKTWNSAGAPVVLTAAGAASLNIRLQRYAAISGTVMDEHEVGLQEHEVVAYRSAHPPVIAARALTDDRGAYRIGGLEPGSYYIRTVGKEYDEGSYLPTFSRESLRLAEARPIAVRLDEETPEVNIRPALGPLCVLAGRVVRQGLASVTIELISDMGVQTATSDAQGEFAFPPAPPGPYELVARLPDVRAPATAYHSLSLDRDEPAYRLTLSAMPELQVSVQDGAGQPVGPAGVQVLIRRVDLSGNGKTETFRGGRLLPGRYELALAPSTALYPTGFSGPPPPGVTRGRADGWNALLVREGTAVQANFVVSPRPATIHGVARGPAREAVAGAPVFLEAFDPDSQSALTETRMTLSDTQGRFEFYGLAPGQYRLLATFEFKTPEVARMDAAKTTKLEEGQDQPLDLDLYVAK